MATELSVAEAIRDGHLSSPQRLGTMDLVALRITGTGASYRAGLNEYVWRDESHYLNDEFLRRCNGLPVIWEHPPQKPKLDSEEFGQRVIGSIMLPYIKGSEVWGIARIYDAEAIDAIRANQLSTSPGVVFVPSDGNETFNLPNGETFLIEGNPSLLDHLAVLPAGDLGVWDKGGDPTGVSTSTARDSMSEEEKAAAAREDAAKLDKIIGALDGLGKRMDAFEADKSRKDAEEAEKKTEEKVDHKDAETEVKCDAEYEKREDRKDAEDVKETAMADRKDAGETEEERRALEKANEVKAEKERDDARKDAAAAHAKNAELSDRLAALESFMREQTRELSASERDALATTQARWDSVAAMFGDRAPQPIGGESSLAYRKRNMERFKKHSPKFKDSRFDSADAGMIDAIEEIIRNDAISAARTPAQAGAGILVPTVTQAGGREITRFYGDPMSWMQHFMTGAQVGSFVRPQRGN